MYVCLCRGITDHQINEAIDQGARTLGNLRKKLGVATQCGKCACTAQELLDKTDSKQPEFADVTLFYSAVS